MIDVKADAVIIKITCFNPNIAKIIILPQSMLKRL